MGRTRAFRWGVIRRRGGGGERRGETRRNRIHHTCRQVLDRRVMVMLELGLRKNQAAKIKKCIKHTHPLPDTSTYKYQWLAFIGFTHLHTWTNLHGLYVILFYLVGLSPLEVSHQYPPAWRPQSWLSWERRKSRRPWMGECHLFSAVPLR